MGKGSRRDMVLERHWRDRMANWHSSGLTVRAFCHRHDLSEPTFHYWKRELQSRDGASSRSSNRARLSDCATDGNRTRPVFVPVTVLPATVTVEVRCPSGHVVRLPATDSASLSNLFSALASLPSLGVEDFPC